MRFAIIGHARSGKSEFARYLADYMGLNTVNTSDWLVEVEKYRRAALFVLLDGGVENETEFDKEKCRPWLIALGDAVCAQQPGFLIEQAFRRGSVITGIRRQEELEYLPKDVVVIFIDKEGVVQDNFDIPMSSAKYVIKNNGSLDDLKESAEKIALGCLASMADSIARRG